MTKDFIAYAVLAAIGIAAAGGVSARSIEDHQFEQGKERIEPDMGYVYLTAPNRFAGSFIRVADEDDKAEYQEKRAVAYAEALEDYEKDYERWQRNAQRADGSGDIPEKPEKPTEETFGFSSIEEFLASGFGPTHIYAKYGGNYAYLEALKPGTYIWYGPVFFAKNQGMMGQCYCMGTISFDVAPGVITNLGNSLFAMPRWQDDRGAPTPKIKDNSGLNGFLVKLPERSGKLDYTLPSELAAHGSVVPDFYAVGKINNFYRQMIARIAPIDGVIAYDRDRIIDLRAETDQAHISEGSGVAASGE